MRIAVIGTTGEGKKTSSGQEIRTQILMNALSEYYGKKNVFLMDTGLVKQSKIKSGLSLIKCLLLYKNIILIVSRNGLHSFLPILSFCQRYLGKRIYNNIIGGNILELIAENPKYVRYMASFTVNWVQMKSLANGLIKLGVNNSEVLPNSKPIKSRLESVNYTDNGVKRYCTFSRISKAKGIELAISTIECINDEAGKTIAMLDIYGVPDQDYEDEFQHVMEGTSDCITYKGLVSYDKSPEVLAKYYMLLFPTTFYGEGFPGTILDAYASGLPVLASDWKFNPESIHDGETGYLYNHSSPDDFKKKLVYSINHENEICTMRKNCLQEADKYTPEKVMPIIFEKINNQRR